MKISSTENLRRVNGNRSLTPEYPDLSDPYILSTRRSNEPIQKSENSACERMKTRIIYFLIIIVILLVGVLSYALVVVLDEKTNAVEHSVDNAAKVDLPKEQSMWYDHALNELRSSVKSHHNKNRAKNIILFMGDGMGISTISAARIYKYGEGGQLSWESFSNTGLLKVSIRPLAHGFMLLAQ